MLMQQLSSRAQSITLHAPAGQSTDELQSLLGYSDIALKTIERPVTEIEINESNTTLFAITETPIAVSGIMPTNLIVFTAHDQVVEWVAQQNFKYQLVVRGSK